MSLQKIIKEIQNTSDQNFPYRVYKKTIEYYRVERREGSRWEEVHTDENIKHLILTDCNLVVDEDGRQKTLEMTGADAEDVPVHAWIECKEYLIMEDQPSPPNDILYYNPYMVTQFMDRKKLENKQNPTFEAIYQCEKIVVIGNKLYYENATDTDTSPKYMDNNMDLLKK